MNNRKKSFFFAVKWLFLNTLNCICGRDLKKYRGLYLLNQQTFMIDSSIRIHKVLGVYNRLLLFKNFFKVFSLQSFLSSKCFQSFSIRWHSTLPVLGHLQFFFATVEKIDKNLQAAGRCWKEACLKLNRELVETRTELLAWEI